MILLEWIKSFVIFWYMVVWGAYVTYQNSSSQERCQLLYIASLFDLKTAQMNVLHSLIWEFMHYEFELGYNKAEATKNICCVKGLHLSHNRWFKKFFSGCKNLNNKV